MLVRHRNRRSMIRAIAISAASVFIAYCAFARTASQITRTTNPEFALQMVSDEPVALAAVADRMSMSTLNVPLRNRIELNARRSLREQAINSSALRILGTMQDARGHSGETQKFLSMTERMSRRDLGAQLWFIEKAVLENDLDNALVHYDRALRVRVESRDLLFPILANAMDSVEIQKAIGKYVKPSNPWLIDFLNYVVQNSLNPAHIADAIRFGGGLPAGRQYRDVEALLLWHLSDKADPYDARQFYSSLAGADEQQLSSLAFSEMSINPALAPLTWSAIRNGATSGAFVKSAPGFSFHAEAVSGESGVVARKMIFLTPGVYELTVSADTSAMASDGQAGLTLTCLGREKPHVIWSASLRTPAKSGLVAVGSECKAFFADIQISGGSAQTGSELTINRLALDRKRF